MKTEYEPEPSSAKTRAIVGIFFLEAYLMGFVSALCVVAVSP